MKIYIVEYLDGTFSFWVHQKLISNLHNVARAFEVEENFTVGELIDYIAYHEDIERMKAI